MLRRQHPQRLPLQLASVEVVFLGAVFDVIWVGAGFTLVSEKAMVSPRAR